MRSDWRVCITLQKQSSMLLATPLLDPFTQRDLEASLAKEFGVRPAPLPRRSVARHIMSMIGSLYCLAVAEMAPPRRRGSVPFVV